MSTDSVKLLDRLEQKRAIVLERFSRILALVKQGHLDGDEESTLEIERVLDKVMTCMIEAHTLAYKNANSNMLKKWDLNA